MSIERLARALGVWWDRMNIPVDEYRGAVRHVGGQVQAAASRAGRDPMWVDVDEGTSLMFLLALAAELRLDVGRCPACEDRGGGWEWHSTKTWTYNSAAGTASDQTKWLIAQGWSVAEVFNGHNVEHLCSRPCPECSEPGPPIELELKISASSLARTRMRDEGWELIGGTLPIDGCKATDIWRRPGPPQPTGRRILGAEAILEAMPRLVEHFYSSPQQRAWSHRGPGDKATRDALAVRADKLQAEGDPFGELLALWLRGTCPECEGSGEEPEPSVLSPPADSPVTSALCHTKVRPARRGDEGWPGIRDWIEVDTSCLKCRGHGTLLGAEWAALESLVELWCGRLECDVCTFGGLRTNWQATCECGGTGRKK